MEATNYTREQLAQYILNTAKDSVISKIKSIVSKEEQEEIVGYTVHGKPITAAEMNKKLARSEEDYKAGRVTTHEELLKEMKTW